MQTSAQLTARIEELNAEAGKATKAYEEGLLEKKRYRGVIDRIFQETKAVGAELNVLKKAQKYSGGGEAATGGATSG